MIEEEIKSISKHECERLLQSEKGYNGISFQEFWEEGAKWGMEHAIEWHDLRKNHDDLPSHSGLYCAQNGEVREYDKEEKSWFTVHFEPCMNCTEDTFLWCELPLFKDKE